MPLNELSDRSLSLKWTLARFPSSSSLTRFKWCFLRTGFSFCPSVSLNAKRSAYFVNHTSGMIAISPLGNLNSTFLFRINFRNSLNGMSNSPNRIFAWMSNQSIFSLTSTSMTALPTKYFLSRLSGWLTSKPRLSRFTRFSFNHENASDFGMAIRYPFMGNPSFWSVCRKFFSMSLWRVIRWNIYSLPCFSTVTLTGPMLSPRNLCLPYLNERSKTILPDSSLLSSCCSLPSNKEGAFVVWAVWSSESVRIGCGSYVFFCISKPFASMLSKLAIKGAIKRL